MQKEFDCGISISRIVAWLANELHLECEGNAWLYESAEGTCTITTSPLPDRVMGRIALERTALRVAGDASALADFERAFTLRFMSAGG